MESSGPAMFFPLLLSLVSLTSDCVTATVFGHDLVVQRVNFGAVFLKQSSSIDHTARQWTHLLRLALPSDQGFALRIGQCSEGSQLLCRLQDRLKQESFHVNEEINQILRNMTKDLKDVLPRPPEKLPRDSFYSSAKVGDGFGSQLSKVHIDVGGNFTNLTGMSALYQVLEVPSIFASMVVSTMNFERYRDAIAALSKGRLTTDLVDYQTLKLCMRRIRRQVKKKYEEYDLLQQPLRDFYASVEVKGYMDDRFLYISIPFTVHHPQVAALDVYKTTTFPVAISPRSLHATEVAEVPEYFAVSQDRSSYAELSSEQLWRCSGQRLKTCNFVLPTSSLSEPSCVLGLYVNSPEMIRSHCRFVLLPYGVRKSITDIAPGVLLMSRVSSPLLDCPRTEDGPRTGLLSGCHQCVRELPCGCRLHADGLVFPATPCSHHSAPGCLRQFLGNGNSTKPRRPSNNSCDSLTERWMRVAYPANAAMMMVYPKDEDLPQSARSELSASEQVFEFPDVEDIFRGWNNTKARQTAKKWREIRHQERMVRREASAGWIVFFAAMTWIFGVLSVCVSWHCGKTFLTVPWRGRALRGLQMISLDRAPQRPGRSRIVEHEDSL